MPLASLVISCCVAHLLPFSYRAKRGMREQIWSRDQSNQLFCYYKYKLVTTRKPVLFVKTIHSCCQLPLVTVLLVNAVHIIKNGRNLACYLIHLFPQPFIICFDLNVFLSVISSSLIFGVICFTNLKNTILPYSSH